MRPLTAAALAAIPLGAYAAYEPYRYRLVTHRVEVPEGVPEVMILHLSDTHFTGRNKALGAFLASLPERLGMVPELVVATGDLIEDNSGIEPAVDALAGLEALWGRFYVLGSHDYYQSDFRADTYAKYLGGHRKPVTALRAATDRLEHGLTTQGWVPLTNTTTVLETPKGKIRLSGLDDPYLNRHRTSHIKRKRGEALAVGLVHSPDVVSEWMLAGFDLVLAGHTHAGQVRVPLLGAVVTNCSLPTGLAGGLHRVGHGWLHVSPGLGTGKFGPIRFNCRPEATMMRLSPARR
jgi:uncharacterized protein